VVRGKKAFAFLNRRGRTVNGPKKGKGGAGGKGGGKKRKRPYLLQKKKEKEGSTSSVRSKSFAGKKKTPIDEKGRLRVAKEKPRYPLGGGGKSPGWGGGVKVHTPSGKKHWVPYKRKRGGVFPCAVKKGRFLKKFYFLGGGKKISLIPELRRRLLQQKENSVPAERKKKGLPSLGTNGNGMGKGGNCLPRKKGL